MSYLRAHARARARAHRRLLKLTRRLSPMCASQPQSQALASQLPGMSGQRPVYAPSDSSALDTLARQHVSLRDERREMSGLWEATVVKTSPVFDSPRHSTLADALVPHAPRHCMWSAYDTNAPHGGCVYVPLLMCVRSKHGRIIPSLVLAPAPQKATQVAREIARDSEQ